MSSTQTTHSTECWKWHLECAGREVERLRDLLRSDETVRRITDSGDVQQVFDWYLNGGEHRRSVDDWCETCSTRQGPVYHDPWPETSELDVVRAVLAALAGDDQ